MNSGSKEKKTPQLPLVPVSVKMSPKEWKVGVRKTADPHSAMLSLTRSQIPNYLPPTPAMLKPTPILPENDDCRCVGIVNTGRRKTADYSNSSITQGRRRFRSRKRKFEEANADELKSPDCDDEGKDVKPDLSSTDFPVPWGELDAPVRLLAQVPHFKPLGLRKRLQRVIEMVKLNVSYENNDDEVVDWEDVEEGRWNNSFSVHIKSEAECISVNKKPEATFKVENENETKVKLRNLIRCISDYSNVKIESDEHDEDKDARHCTKSLFPLPKKMRVKSQLHLDKSHNSSTEDMDVDEVVVMSSSTNHSQIISSHSAPKDLVIDRQKVFDCDKNYRDMDDDDCDENEDPAATSTSTTKYNTTNKIKASSNANNSPAKLNCSPKVEKPISNHAKPVFKSGLKAALLQSKTVQTQGNRLLLAMVAPKHLRERPVAIKDACFFPDEKIVKPRKFLG